jgi:hypothetical protein
MARFNAADDERPSLPDMNVQRPAYELQRITRAPEKRGVDGASPDGSRTRLQDFLPKRRHVRFSAQSGRVVKTVSEPVV